MLDVDRLESTMSQSSTLPLCKRSTKRITRLQWIRLSQNSTKVVKLLQGLWSRHSWQWKTRYNNCGLPPWSHTICIEHISCHGQKSPMAFCCSHYYYYCCWLLLLLLTIKVHTSVEDIDGLDDVENSLLYHNQAIIHYHLRQYSEAISIGEKLYQFLEPFGTWFLWQSHFLLCQNTTHHHCSVLFVCHCLILPMCPRRTLCSGGLLSSGGFVPAYIPAREGSPSPGGARQTRLARQPEKWERRGLCW